MVTRYFDPVNGSDSYDGLTSGTAWASYDAKRTSVSTSDSLMFKRGTTQTIVTTNMDAKAGVAGAPTYYGAYGVAQVPYSIWVNPSATGNMILNVSGRSNIIFEDMYFDGQTVCQYSLYMFANGATACTGNRISRCYFTRMKSGEAGLVVGGTSTSTGDSGDHIIADSFFFDNPGHGMLINGAHSVRVRGCKFYRNGNDAIFGAHGLSCKARRTDAPSGWTNTTGTIYSRALAAYETAVYYVKSTLNPYRRLELTAGTATSPGLGEFGVSGGNLYVNIGTNANAQGINYAWGRCYNLIIEGCESYNNYNDGRSPDPEGHGFAFDDYTESSKFISCNSHDNAGSGYSFNRGDNNIIEGCLATNNGLTGISGAACKNAKIRNNTFRNNNTGTAYNAEIAFFTYAQIDVSNNHLGATGRLYGVDVDTTSTMTGNKNNCYGHSSRVENNGPVLTNTTTVNPLLDSSNRPTAPTLIKAGTFLGAKDFNGRYFYNPSTIGAVETDSDATRRTFRR